MKFSKWYGIYIFGVITAIFSLMLFFTLLNFMGVSFWVADILAASVTLVFYVMARLIFPLNDEREK